jgi:hypothetical protein
VLLGFESRCPDVFARFEVALKKGAIARVVYKFVQVFDLDTVTHRTLDNRIDGKIISLDSLDRAAKKVLPASLLCESTDFIGKLLSEITHLPIVYAVK